MFTELDAWNDRFNFLYYDSTNFIILLGSIFFSLLGMIIYSILTAVYSKTKDKWVCWNKWPKKFTEGFHGLIVKQSLISFLYGAFLELFLSAAVCSRMPETTSVYSAMDYLSMFSAFGVLIIMCLFVVMATILNLTVTKKISAYHNSLRLQQHEEKMKVVREKFAEKKNKPMAKLEIGSSIMLNRLTKTISNQVEQIARKHSE